MSTEFHYAAPPLLLEHVIDDIQQVIELFERGAPYKPLGGWFRPDASGEVLSPMWFQKDWVYDDFMLAGSELFLHHAGFIEAARQFYDAEVVVPRSIYVNLMAAIAEGGPAHTDNPVFSGRDRTNTPMMLLRTMLWSGLFNDWLVKQATSIWWLDDVEGGGLYYWPQGPSQLPAHHVGAMANTALVGDNHGMFHQVGPVGPFDKGTRMVGANAELAPANDGSDDWVVIDHGEEVYRAPLQQFRASVLWKADVYANEEERQRMASEALSLDDVVSTFNKDLASRNNSFRLQREKLEEQAHIDQLRAVYPEAIPVGACKSMFEI